MNKNILEQDYKRYTKASDMPAFQKYFRKVQSNRFFPLLIVYKFIFRILKEIRHIEIPKTTQIGEGLYIVYFVKQNSSKRVNCTLCQGHFELV